MMRMPVWALLAESDVACEVFAIKFDTIHEPFLLVLTGCSDWLF